MHARIIFYGILFIGLVFLLPLCSLAQEAHVWPIYQPEVCPTTYYSSFQGEISATLGEFRTDGSYHFHGGVDIPEPDGTNVYHVQSDDYREQTVVRADNGVVEVEEILYQGGSTTEKRRFRYVHIANINVYVGQTVIDCWYPPLSGWGRDYPIATTYYPSQPHLHFAEAFYTNDPGYYGLPQIGWYMLNPLDYLDPWTDNVYPAFESGMEHILYKQGTSTQITAGDGSESNPYKVYYDFDIYTQAHDYTPSQGYNKKGLWAVRWRLEAADYGNRIPSDSEGGYDFVLLPVQSNPGNNYTSGVTYIYDISIHQSTNSNYYYWASNAISLASGGTNTFVPINQLRTNVKYRVDLMIRDIYNYYLYDETKSTFWVIRPSTDVANEESQLLPGEYVLGDAYPNPFNPVTIIPIKAGYKSQIKLQIINLVGQTVKTLVEGELKTGEHLIKWNGTDQNGRPVSSGVYLCRLVTDKGPQVRKLILTK
ncbi:hypothetical protein TRIP_C20090 [Candidatus Zixiibacteriota bacterium]|nr:hypothetical protein TRIP_C20090 [candidate division Zixibacteria bacterium]